jgi:hypothetical protein
MELVFWWIVERWNPGRWHLRIAGFSRWIMAAIAVGGAVTFAVMFAKDAYNDVALSRHGAAVTATVESVWPDGTDTEYLLSFTIDGKTDQQWTTHVSDLKVGQTVTVLVDQRDHQRMTSADAYGRRWGAFTIAGIGVAFFAWLGIMILRMDAEGFLQYSRMRYGHF